MMEVLTLSIAKRQSEKDAQLGITGGRTGNHHLRKQRHGRTIVFMATKCVENVFTAVTSTATSSDANKVPVWS